MSMKAPIQHNTKGKPRGGEKHLEQPHCEVARAGSNLEDDIRRFDASLKDAQRERGASETRP